MVSKTLNCDPRAALADSLNQEVQRCEYKSDQTIDERGSVGFAVIKVVLLR